MAKDDYLEKEKMVDLKASLGSTQSQNLWACLEVGSIGYGSGFGLQTKNSLRLMLVSAQDLRFWWPGGKFWFWVRLNHWLGLHATFVHKAC